MLAIAHCPFSRRPQSDQALAPPPGAHQATDARSGRAGLAARCGDHDTSRFRSLFRIMANPTSLQLPVVRQQWRPASVTDKHSSRFVSHGPRVLTRSPRHLTNSARVISAAQARTEPRRLACYVPGERFVPQQREKHLAPRSAGQRRLKAEGNCRRRESQPASVVGGHMS